MAKQLAVEQTLWCLPYDTDSIFKYILKVPFSYYLNNLLSNEHFPAYQAAMAKEVADRSAWNEKSWRLIQFFEFLNDSFQIDKWDNYISFIEDNLLRNIMGFFRLWIDTERLYIFNFLKLDSNEFQEERIYLSLYRTLIFFNSIFSEYMYKDFDGTFLNQFVRQCDLLLRELGNVSTTETNDLISNIFILLNNVKKRQKYLVQPNVLHSLKKGAAIKVNKESQVIKEVESRLKNSAFYKKNLDQKLRLNLFIKKSSFIHELTEPIRQVYYPLKMIERQYQNNVSMDLSKPQDKKKEQRFLDQVQKFKKTTKNASGIAQKIQIYEQLQANGRNPYTENNFTIYGQPVKVDMDEKARYKKKQELQVVYIQDYDSSKYYYDNKFIDHLNHIDSGFGRVTEKDINLSGNAKSKKQNFKGNDENTRVYNLKWHQDKEAVLTRRSNTDSMDISKDYDNNLLFKNTLEEQLLQSKNNRLDKLRQQLSTKTYTIALLEQTANEIHPPHIAYSYGSDYFLNKTPTYLDLNNFKMLNQNKFDFMKKVIGYSTAQKKIKSIILQKNVPDLYPRSFSDVRQLCYNPEISYEKRQLAKGNSLMHPPINL